MTHYYFHNGHITPSSEACIPLNDLGLLRGYGMFEYFRTYNGQFFRLNDYLNRLFASAAVLQIDVPLTREEITAALMELNKHLNRPTAAFRMILTAGISENGLTADKASLMIVTEDVPPGILKTVRAMTQNYMRELPSVKSTNYLNLMLRQKEFPARNVQEVLYLWNGQVLEFSRSNIFLAKNGALATPKNNVLSGITRRTILEIAQKSQIPCEERDIAAEELWQADEIFLTASGVRLAAVTHIDNRAIGNGEIGDKTRLLSKLLDQHTDLSTFDHARLSSTGTEILAAS